MDGEVVVVLEVAVPKGAPRAWIGPLGLPDEDWAVMTGKRGILRGHQPILVLEYFRQDLLVGMQCPACLMNCQNLCISGLEKSWYFLGYKGA